MLSESVTVGNGKYTITNDNGRLTALRNGEPWDRDLVGDNLVYWMMVRIQELEAAVRDSSSRYAASAEEYLRSRYGAYKAHHEWRSLEESFIAGAIHSSRAASQPEVKS